MKRDGWLENLKFLGSFIQMWTCPIEPEKSNLQSISVKSNKIQYSLTMCEFWKNSIYHLSPFFPLQIFSFHNVHFHKSLWKLFLSVSPTLSVANKLFIAIPTALFFEKDKDFLRDTFQIYSWPFFRRSMIYGTAFLGWYVGHFKRYFLKCDKEVFLVKF